MKLICLHQDKLNPLLKMGAAMEDLSPDGLWKTSYHVISMSDEQFSAMGAIYGGLKSGTDYQDITPVMLIGQATGEVNGFLYCRGGKIANGTKLRVRYLGELHEAQVRGGKIWLKDKSYTTPSKAARAVTHNNVNGWRFWEYFDEDLNKWRKLEFSPGKSK